MTPHSQIPTVRLIALIATAAFANQFSAQAQNFVNGSFETGDWTGWTHGASATVDYPGSDGPWAAGFDGKHWVWLGNYDYASLGGPWIKQTVGGFTVGQTYDLKFLQSSEAGFYPVSGGNHETTTVDIGGTSTLSSVVTSLPSDGSSSLGRGLWNVWTPEDVTFKADSTSLTFTITGNDVIPGDVGVDDFSISTSTGSVPDSGATLSLLALAACGLAGFRRKLAAAKS